MVFSLFHAVSSHVRPFPCPPSAKYPGRSWPPPAAHRPRKSRQWLVTPPGPSASNTYLQITVTLKQCSLLLTTSLRPTGVSAVTVGYVALYRVGYWCMCGTPVVFVFFPRKQPINFLTNIFPLWERCFSSDYQPGRPMKWEPRTPLSEGPRSPLEHRRLPRAQRWQQVIFCKSKSSHKSFPCKSKSSHKSFPCKSKSSHKSFGQTSSQVKSQVIWSDVKSSQVTSHLVQTQVKSQVSLSKYKSSRTLFLPLPS